MKLVAMTSIVIIESESLPQHSIDDYDSSSVVLQISNRSKAEPECHLAHLVDNDIVTNNQPRVKL